MSCVVPGRAGPLLCSSGFPRAPSIPSEEGGDAVRVRRGLGHIQGASKPVCTGQVLKSLQGASPRSMEDGKDRRKSIVLTGNMVVPAIRAQGRDQP